MESGDLSADSVPVVEQTNDDMFGQEGRDATLQSRNAAKEYADRNHSGNQWFGHDSSAPPPEAGAKLHSRGVGEYATKNKGESEAWYNYDAVTSTDQEPPKNGQPKSSEPPVPATDLSDAASHEESKQRAKAGKQMSQNWYTHEGYGDLMTPLEKKRAAEKEDRKKKITDSDAAGKSATSPTKGATKNGGAPDWYTHEGHGDGEVSPTHHHKRANPGLGDYAQKAKDGSAKEWYSHDPEVPESAETGGQSPRVKPEGQQYADRNKGSVQDWLFNYEKMSLSDADTPRSSKKISAKKYEDSVNAVMHME